MTKRYTVHARSPQRFDTLEDAKAFAQRYFERTGNIVAITESGVSNPARADSI